MSLGPRYGDVGIGYLDDQLAVKVVVTLPNVSPDAVLSTVT